MSLGYDESAVPVAGFYLFRDLFGFLRLHDVLERIILDIADDPLFRRTVAGRDISPGVDEEKVVQCAARGSVTGFVAAQPAMDAAIEISTAVIFQFVLESPALGCQKRFDEFFVLVQGLVACQIIVLFMEVPRIMDDRVAQFDIQRNAKVVQIDQVFVVVRGNDHRESDILAFGLFQFEHCSQRVVEAVDGTPFGVVQFRKSLKADADQGVGVLIWQRDDRFGIVSVRAQLQQGSLGI